MIRLIRMFSVMLCVISVGLFVFSGIYMNRGTDEYGPEIQMEETEIEVSIHATEVEMLQGVTAEDKKDGDVSDSLMIEKMDMFFEKGKRKITINAFDSNNNVTKAERTVVYTDYVSPRIVLEGPLRAAINNMDEMLDVIKVEDCLEGDITENLQIIPNGEDASYVLPGEYAMKLSVVNGVGDLVELPVTVELYDSLQDGSQPKVLLTDYLIYTSIGQQIDPQIYLRGVKVRNTEYVWSDFGEIPYSKAEISIESDVNIQESGVYEVVYSLENEGILTKTRLIVVVGT